MMPRLQTHHYFSMHVQAPAKLQQESESSFWYGNGQLVMKYIFIEKTVKILKAEQYTRSSFMAH